MQASIRPARPSPTWSAGMVAWAHSSSCMSGTSLHALQAANVRPTQTAPSKSALSLLGLITCLARSPSLSLPANRAGLQI